MNNTWKYIGSFFTALVFSLFILLSIFLVNACENYLVPRSTSCDFFLALELLFLHGIRDLLHGIRATGFQAYFSARLLKFYKAEEPFVLSIRAHLVSYSSLKESLNWAYMFSPCFICSGFREYILDRINISVWNLLNIWAWLPSTIMNGSPSLALYYVVRDSIEFLWL